MSDLIYLDNAATTWPKPPQVHQFMHDFYRDFGVNPGRSGYDKALECEQVIHRCRTKLASFFGCTDPNRLVFAYNATDALNQVIQGVLSPGDHVISTALEHNSVIRPLWHMMTERDVQVTYIPFDGQGFIDPDAVKAAFRPNTKLVIVNHGSNVIGTYQKVDEIGKICREAGIFFAIDASQTAGVVPIDQEAMYIDAVCFTGHKSLFGPTGIGGIAVGKDARIRSTRYGGTGVRSVERPHLAEYPYHLEAGTINTMGIAGLLAGQEFIESRGGAQAICDHEMMLMKKLWEGIRNIDGVKVYMAESLEGHIPVLSMNVEGFEAGNTGTILDVDHNIATRTGLHCAPGVHEQLGTVAIKGTVRFAVGPFNTEADIEAAIAGVESVAKVAKNRK